MTEIRNIILIGRTGQGKSTLANVITGTDKFKESDKGVSETKNAQAEIIKDEEVDVEYRIVDTIGIGDTQWSTKQVLFKIAEAVRMVKEGVNQVLFVTSGRFTKEEIEAYNLLRTVIFDEEIIKYTTVVRTRFAKFRKPEETAEDKKKLIEENNNIADVIKNCNKVLYVNNPPIDTGDDDQDEVGRKVRGQSREILLTHAYQCQEIYKPGNLDEMNERIGGYMDETEKKQREIDEFKDLIEQQQKQVSEERERMLQEQEKARLAHEKEMRELAERQEREKKEYMEKLEKAYEEQKKVVADKEASFRKMEQEKNDYMKQVSATHGQQNQDKEQEKNDYIKKMEDLIKVKGQENESQIKDLVNMIKSKEKEMESLKGDVSKQMQEAIQKMAAQNEYLAEQLAVEKNKGGCTIH